MPDRSRDEFDPAIPFSASGEGGRFGRFFSRVFENPENPLGWSLKLFRVAGIVVRVHLFTVIFMIGQVLWSIPQSNAGFGFTMLAMVSLFVLVLLHEFGHCFACRWVGGGADRIVMLPIGGLALCRPPETWRSNFITTAGGPAVNLVLLPITSLSLVIAGLGSAVVFNPFAPFAALAQPEFQSAGTVLTWAKIALWWVHYVNLILLAFNVLVPAYPMDGGRLLQAALWRKMGYHRATDITIYVGFAASMGMGVLGVVANQTTLVVIAALCLWSCWVERKRLRGEADLGAADLALGQALGPIDDIEDPWTARKREKERQALEEEQAEVDRILDKIAEQGMHRLTRAEKRTLQRATERRRSR